MQLSILHVGTPRLGDGVRIRAGDKAGGTPDCPLRVTGSYDGRRQRNREATEELHLLEIFGSRSRGEPLRSLTF